MSFRLLVDEDTQARRLVEMLRADGHNLLTISREAEMNEKLQVILSQLRSRLEEIYGEQPAAALRYRLVKIILFGSQARGDAKPDSDIDVLVVLKGEVNPGEEIEKTGNIIAQLSLENDEVISCLYMDEYRFTHRHGPLLRNIRKEGLVPLRESHSFKSHSFKSIIYQGFCLFGMGCLFTPRCTSGGVTIPSLIAEVG